MYKKDEKINKPQLCKLTIFISSPGDVQPERDQVHKEVERLNRNLGEERNLVIKVLDWKTRVMPQIGPLPQRKINREIREYDIYVGIMWKRFGTPTGNINSKTKKEFQSGTEEEFELAYNKWQKHSKPYIIFYFKTASYAPKSSKETEQWTKVLTFKEKMQKKGLLGGFRTTTEFSKLFYDHINGIVQKLFPIATANIKARPAIRKKPETLQIPVVYRTWLENKLATVELLATTPKEGFTPPRLSSIYVPSPTTSWSKEIQKDQERQIMKQEEVPLLLNRFARESLYVTGIAGCGKSTFCKWVAWLLCHGGMPKYKSAAGQKQLIEKYPLSLHAKLPVLVPLREFWPYLGHRSGQDNMTLAQFQQSMADWASEQLSGIKREKLLTFLQAGRAVVLLDGLDEVPLTSGEPKQLFYPRRMLVSALTEALPEWQKRGNRILLTSRPYGLRENEITSLGLPQTDISDLPRPLQQHFIHRWFHALQYDGGMAAEMLAHLDEREELSVLSGNPVLLMAMCSLFPQGKRLPQDKSELYKITIDRLLFNRYRADTEVAVNHNRLGVIAYSMHTGHWLGQNRSTPQAEISEREIEIVLSEYLQEHPIYEKGQRAVQEVRDELLTRSGLLVGTARQKAAFYHLSFQEYLAGRRIVQFSADNLAKFIRQFGDTPQWRQTLAFAFGAALQDVFSPERAVQLIHDLLANASLARLNELVLLADLIEITYRKKLCLAPDRVSTFQKLCLQAIEKQVELAKRFELGRVLGIVGDPRLVTDLRAEAAYVVIPAGIYKFQGKDTGIDNAFMISRYPVTNVQFQLFVDDGGYAAEKQWWSKEGLAWRKKNKIAEPEYWRQGRWNGANFPVVGVSFYEAGAFCKWAGGRLPTELEWEAAASGPEGNEYPWGNDWKDEICSSGEVGLGRTSPVGLFPGSRSAAFGLEDMAGNVREWCKDLYGNSGRVVQGGAFNLNASRMRCSDRYWVHPGNRGLTLGFRVVRGAQSK